MANPRGQQRDKIFAQALRMEIAEAGPDLKCLRTIARKALDLAEAGEAWAVQFVADRLDGKPAQSVEVSGDVEHRVIRAPAIEASATAWADKHVPSIHRADH